MPETLFKYQALGNDFLIVDRRASQRDLDDRAVRSLCDRRLGIGADGVLVVLGERDADARMIVHNADGSVPEMCGNGLRCVAKFLADRAPNRPEKLAVRTGAGLLQCSVTYRDGEASMVEIAMGAPRLVDRHLPSREGKPFIACPLPSVPGIIGTAVSMGNPHLVLFDRDPREAAELGPSLEHAPEFPERANVEWVTVEGDGLRVVVWERGCGLTQACGTGACAALVAAVLVGRRSEEQWTPVRLPGGTLDILVRSGLSQVLMRGSAEPVFEVVLPSAESMAR